MKSHPATVLACVVILLIITLSGCAVFPSDAPPAWVNGESEKFPKELYLLGVGEGDSRIVAEQRAYAAVARIFEVHVEAQSRDSETYSIQEREGTSQTSRQVTLDHVTKVSTKKILGNVIILARWEQLHPYQYFVLAGMDRIQSEKILREELSELDEAIDKDVKESRSANDSLTKIRRLKRAIRSTEIRNEINSDLRIVRSSGLGDPPVYHLEDLNNELAHYLREELSVRLQIQGDQNSLIRRALLEGLSREGFYPIDQEKASPATNRNKSFAPKAKADLLIKGAATMWELDLPDPRFVYVRWCADLLVLEDKPQRIIGVVSRSGREGHITKGEAFVRASKAMQAAVISDVTDALSDFIYGELEELAPPTSTACPR
ncbi:MAG: LPP20 family lipoprotein [Nitrospirota bacterium]|nr:MAG: LPP20 family lipoprotein [Nitrospirota bacterium]